MNVAYHLRLREREEVPIVEQTFLGILEAVAADVSFRHAIRADGRTHGTIDYRDAIFEDLLDRMSAGIRHIPLCPVRHS